MGDLKAALQISASGMAVQRERLNVVAQNIANSESVSMVPGGEPYRRKTISFKTVLNKEMGAATVAVDKIGTDPSDFDKRYMPTHPAADLEGYVLYPNVNRLMEIQDAKEAERSYEANLAAVDIAKSMITRTLDLLR